MNTLLTPQNGVEVSEHPALNVDKNSVGCSETSNPHSVGCSETSEHNALTCGNTPQCRKCRITQELSFSRVCARTRNAQVKDFLDQPTLPTLPTPIDGIGGTP